MIRPITVICWILALSAGLYLYRAKHEVELMDKHIEQIAKETNDIRAESRHLLDDWIRLGEPEQLHKYSDEYLGLKTIAPTQFARLSDLPARLPAPQADPVPDPADMVAQSSAPADAQAVTATDDMRQADSDDLPVPPIPPVTLPEGTPLLTSVSLPGVTVPLQARPVTPRTAAAAEPEQKPRPETHLADEPRATLVPRQPVSNAQGANGQAANAQAANAQAANAQAGNSQGTTAQSADAGTAQPRDPPLLQAPRAQAAASPQAPRTQPAAAGWQPERQQPAQSVPPSRQPSQTQGSPPQGLPPLQAQDTRRPDVTAQRGPAQTYAAQPVGKPIPWNTDNRVTDSRGTDARRDAQPRPAEAQVPAQRPMQAAAAPTQYSGGQYPGGQYAGSQNPGGQYAPGRYPAAQTQTGSLLGTSSRPPLPLPLPAPTPVSASYPRPYPAPYPAPYPNAYPAPYPYAPGR